MIKDSSVIKNSVVKWDRIFLGLTKQDLNYIAGFLDGEGCFHISKHYKIAVSCSNSYKPIIERFKKLFGGSFGTIKGRKANHRTQYAWQIVSKDAANFCKIIIPYLKEKAPQAALLVYMDQLMHSKNHQSVKLSDEEQGERNRIFNMAKSLKHITWD